MKINGGFLLCPHGKNHRYLLRRKSSTTLTEEVTLISEDGVSDKTYYKVLKFYGENGLAQIIMQVIIINSWNRIAVSTRQIFEQII